MDEEVIRLLREIKDALKAVEGKFIYTNGTNAPALEELLKKYPVTYKKSQTLMADLYEYIINANEDTWNEIRNRIVESGFKAYVSNTRLPVSGTIGTIQAVAEKAQVYGYNPDAGEWEWIKAVANKLAVYIDQIVKTSRARKIVGIDASSSTTVTAGQTEIITVTPPAGKLYHLISIRTIAKPVSGSTTGTHEWKIVQGYGSYENGVSVFSDYNQHCNIGLNRPESPASQSHDSHIAFLASLQSIYPTQDEPLDVAYRNNTDADQTEARTVKLLFEQFDERED